ncbi:hypothetical protein NAEGRDRAFT_65705 [Naegleria gruberi]|uniref:F-box domain-containing protein n=1 Tax=Naegleria gruberi TaxID=5762 RepID=D2VA16_NAEGR|nr:uncharacterized protein NAEGRDRAFT_65705 [Naegleria gruberi]EFC46351.1 hypothetical protein NAEGRDRAFT_65705 [Naegleria gruberi]|eukprot:XP_002679095.1 hypothetical protein NAEGRDRAFT_65705 [Naegleria gruberi strain NEG-M]
MNELQEDLIFSIFLMCSKTRDVANLLLLNRHWLGVARYEALWRMRFSFFLQDRIEFEEEKLENDAKALMKSKTKGKIKKLNDLRRSHVDEAEKLYHREKVCKSEEGYEDVNFFTGFRFYSIFKKEVKAFLLGRNTEKLTNLMDRTVAPQSNSHSNLAEVIVPITEKWNNLIEFVENNLKPDCGDEIYMDQRYLLQKGFSGKFADSFSKDYSFIKCKLVRQINPSIEESVKEFWNLNRQIIEPVRILTSGKRFKYPINGYYCLQVAVETMDFELVKGILDFLVEDCKKAENEQQVTNPYLNHKEILIFGMKVMSVFLDKSYPVDEIMYYLNCFNQLFPSFVSEEKKKNSFTFKCDEDVIAFSLIEHANYAFRLQFSLELFEKAVSDWRFTKEGVNLIEKCQNNLDDIFMSPNPFVSFRKHHLTVENVIHIFELYEKTQNRCMITDDIIYLFATSRNLDFVKYFCDVRGFKLPNKIPNKIPLIYQYLNASFDSGEQLLDTIEYFIDRIDDELFDDQMSDIVGSSPLQRIISAVVYDTIQNKEKLMRVLTKLLARKPNVHTQIHGVSALDYINVHVDYQYKDDILQLFESYVQQNPHKER